MMQCQQRILTTLLRLQKNIYGPVHQSRCLFSDDVKSFTCHRLSHRGILQASGSDTSALLQGLITNDMGCLDVKCGISSMFAMLLNVQGRILYDMIIYKQDNTDRATYLIECDKSIIGEFISTIKRYRIRKKVDISDISNEVSSWAVLYKDSTELCQVTAEMIGSKSHHVIVQCPDPRVKLFGTRVLLPTNINAEDVFANCTTSDADTYNLRRYKFGIAEGVIDMPPGNSFPLEANAVFMNGVSFSKGCYIGQELTARSHHTGVIRKRLMPVQILSDPHNCKPGDLIVNNDNKNCGKMRNIINKNGLALLRVADVLGKELNVLDKDKQIHGKMHTWIPSWWPRDTDEVVKKALIQSNTDDISK